MMNDILTHFSSLFLLDFKIGTNMSKLSVIYFMVFSCCCSSLYSQEFRQSALTAPSTKNQSPVASKQNNTSKSQPSQPNFTGQWKGEFIDNSNPKVKFGSDKCDYVIELEVNNNKVIGSTFTYFTENGKKYYTICKLEGKIIPNEKYIEIVETERTKTNIPLYRPNCLQIHKLTYFKKDSIETLEGNWVPAPNQTGNCGFGTTKLIRRSLINTFPNIITKKSNDVNSSPKSADKEIVSKDKKNESTKSIKPKNIESVPVDKKEINTENAIAKNKTDSEDVPQIDEPLSSEISKLEKRKNKVLKTIEVESDIINIDLYDNGEVDGDSISLFFNNKLLLSNKKLTTKAIHLSLDIDNQSDVNELVMYAENLGSIPPNTALMIVTDGPNRYEVRITSDLEKSGVIRFIHKPNPSKN